MVLPCRLARDLHVRKDPHAKILPSAWSSLVSQWNWPRRVGPLGTWVAHVLLGSKGRDRAPGLLTGGSLCRYLKEFRTEQCPLFVQHKCTQHRPYTCFHWHFVNQRRRRSIRRRDGTFNYSPDVYCTKYDEATGLCPEGDE